jgi:tol-pal system protein YbgF
MKNLIVLVGMGIVFSMNSSCLKTRAQLKDEAEAAEKPSHLSPTPVRDMANPRGDYAIDEIKSEITRLTGRIEDIERSKKEDSSHAKNAMKEEVSKLETRIQELEKAQAAMIVEIKKIQSSPTAASSQASTADHFKKAKGLFEDEHYEEAIDHLTEYLKGTGLKKAEEATFMRGESYFNIKNYKKAIVDFSKFPENFKKSKLVPAAIFKIAQSFEALKMKEEAKNFYSEVVEKYPKSPEAKKAKAKLK